MKELEKTCTFEQMLVQTFKKMVILEIPKKIQWRIYLDLADFAKRESKFDEARLFYKLVITL